MNRRAACSARDGLYPFAARVWLRADRWIGFKQLELEFESE
jgi:hypothetical protein